MFKSNRLRQILKHSLISVPIGFLVSGGIATISGIQSLYDFVNVFIFFYVVQIILIDFALSLEKEIEKKIKR